MTRLPASIAPDKGSAETAIILRTRGHPLFLRRALRSISQQEYQDYIVALVYNENAQPLIEKAVAAGAENIAGKIVPVPFAVFLNKAEAINAGLEATNSEYVVLHDDDDTWEPQFLSETVNFLKEEKPCASVKGVRTHVKCVYEEIGELSVTEIQCKDWRGNNEKLTPGNMAPINRIASISLVYERSVHTEVGFYRKELPVLEDWDFYLRFLMMADIATIPEKLANYHLRPLTGKKNSNSFFTESDQRLQYQALIRDYYLRNKDEYPRLGLLLQMVQAAGSEYPPDPCND